MQPTPYASPFRKLNLFIWALVLCFCAGCTSQKAASSSRPFIFGKDTFGYPNELVWEYQFTPDGKWQASRRDPPATYSHHCFVVARCAKQFFHHARFDPSKPKAENYTKIVRKIVNRNPRTIPNDNQKIVIPGYANLREFSEAHETLLKAECGGAWQSYFQRGHWRMMFPFSRRHQWATADKLFDRVENNLPPVVHIVRTSDLAINHAILLYDAKNLPSGLEFSVYDPNEPDTPTTLTFDRTTRTFHFPTNKYFVGGKVNIYEVYHSAFY